MLIDGHIWKIPVPCGGDARATIHRHQVLPGVWMLWSVKVPINARRQGFGNRLLEAVTTDLDLNGLVVDLFACPDWSRRCLGVEPLIAWYERHGWERITIDGVFVGPYSRQYMRRLPR